MNLTEQRSAARILIVEDHSASRRVVVRCLQGHELFEAEDGEQALALLETTPVDLVILDLGLPGIDGYEVLRRIKADPKLTATMVIIVTARGQVGEIVKGFEDRADDYVVKPFRLEELQARVTSALRLKGLQDQLRHINQNLEAEVQARTNQLMAQQSFALLGRNAAQLAHNLNSPLTALMGYIEIALMRPERERDDLLVKAREVASEMQAIIARLLSGMRSRDTVVSEGEEVDLNHEVTQQLEFWKVHPQFRYQTDKRVELADDLPPVIVVPSDLKQILTNLIDNALYAMRGRQPAALNFRTSAADGEVRLAVTDTGAGIDPANLERIFEPSFTTKPVGEGTGLGLASCYELASVYGGRLEVESVLGAGTTFTLVLPTAERFRALRPGS